MRNTDVLDADQPTGIEGSSLTISVYYRMSSPSALQTDAPTPMSPEPTVMENLCAPSFLAGVDEPRESFYSAPLVYSDREILYASSISATLNSGVSGRLVLPTDCPPSSANALNDRDEWQSLNQSYFDEVESPTNERANAMGYPATEPVMMDGDVGVQQLKQFDSIPVASSPLSTYHNIGSPSDEPQKPVPGTKVRTRRPAVNPILEPPNPYGRKGKPRCERCRNQRQRVRSLFPSP